MSNRREEIERNIVNIMRCKNDVIEIQWSPEAKQEMMVWDRNYVNSRVVKLIFPAASEAIFEKMSFDEMKVCLQKMYFQPIFKN